MKKVEMNHEYNVEVSQGGSSGINNIAAEVTQSVSGDNIKLNIEVKGDVPNNDMNVDSDNIDITVTASGIEV